MITWPSTSFSPASPHVYTRLLLSSFIACGHNGVPAVSDAEDDSVVALKSVDDVTCDPIPDNHLPKHSPAQNCHATGLWAVQEAAVEDATAPASHRTWGLSAETLEASSYGNGESGLPTRQTQHCLKWISTSEQFY